MARHDVRIISPRLPATTRFRLAVEQRIDGAGGWLVERGHSRAAELLWRACRML